MMSAFTYLCGLESATVFLGLLTSECTGSYSAGIVGASISIIPAHIMRSVGGGYDNECRYDCHDDDILLLDTLFTRR